MPIPFICINCGHSMKAPSKFAGKRVRCKECNEFTPIPYEQFDEAPVRDRFGLDDDDIPRVAKRAPRGGDGLLGESPPPMEVLPKRLGMGEFYSDPSYHKGRNGDAPVCGLPPNQVIWICAAILFVCDALLLSQSLSGPALLAKFTGTVVIQVVGTFIAAGIMALAGGVVDIEASTFARLMSISLAQTVISSVGELIIVFAGQGNVGVVGIVAIGMIVLSLVLLSRSLGLGCLGLIGFVVVEAVIVFVLLFGLGVFIGLFNAGFQPR